MEGCSKSHYSHIHNKVEKSILRTSILERFWVPKSGKIGKMTDPYLRVFRGIIPTLIGFDLSPILGFLLISFLIDLFSSLSTAIG